jgi:hypothetical protein
MAHICFSGDETPIFLDRSDNEDTASLLGVLD